MTKTIISFQSDSSSYSLETILNENKLNAHQLLRSQQCHYNQQGFPAYFTCPAKNPKLESERLIYAGRVEAPLG